MKQIILSMVMMTIIGTGTAFGKNNIKPGHNPHPQTEMRHNGPHMHPQGPQAHHNGPQHMRPRLEAIQGCHCKLCKEIIRHERKVKEIMQHGHHHPLPAHPAGRPAPRR